MRPWAAAQYPSYKAAVAADEAGTATETRPAQLSFAVYRDNDYDLQIQHNEAVNLACEHIGITRTRGDAFFDGTLGHSLVKVVPFNHPLSPLDLEEIKRELSARPDEERAVTVERRGRIRVEIDEFISPSIMERLQEQAGLLAPQIDDWRATVDSVMIDPAYDGQVFNVALADVPEKKTELVAGRYEIDAPAGATTVAVKITDMLGEEVIVTQRV